MLVTSFALGFLIGAITVMNRDRKAVQERMNIALSNGDRALYNALRALSKRFGV